MAKQPGYELIKHGKGSILYQNRKPMGYYNPCGFSNNSELFSEEVKHTVVELFARVEEVYSIREIKPLEEILKDQALVNQLNNPVLLQLMITFGPEGTKLVEFLRKAKVAQN